MTILLRRKGSGLAACRDIAAHSEEGLAVARSDRPLPGGPMVFRWGYTGVIKGALPKWETVNKANAINISSCKGTFRMLLATQDLTMPVYHQECIEQIPWAEADSWVVRPRKHSQGRELHVITDRIELDRAAARCGEGWYMSRLVDKVKEYRVFVVSGRAVSVARKMPGDGQGVAWNHRRGASFINVRWDDWPLKVVKYSIRACDLSGLDFGAVDVMIDAEGSAYVLEVNTAPSLESPYRAECMAKAFDYTIRNGRGDIPLIDEPGGYTKFIHPAICERARIIGE